MTTTIPGATYLGDQRWHFRVWAPFRKRVDLHVFGPNDRLVPLTKAGRGYYEADAEISARDARYAYRLDDQTERPDPCSRFQPEGVHQPSALFDVDGFAWEDGAWTGLSWREYILYELHVGTFTTEGTFEAVIPHLESLRRLGITTIELMPVAQFPGSRNWGYDGVYPFAVQNSYGGPRGLQRLVNACHRIGLAAVLDVVYNHLGPEGNYLADFGPYFTDAYKTPWGAAINLDGPYSDEVREFWITNALYWQTKFHIDALRLDAVHAIKDFSARPFLQELASAVRGRARELHRPCFVVAESNLNDPRIIRSEASGGYGLDAQWNDDFHHALHALLTGERSGYYEDFGELAHLVEAFRNAFVYTGQYSVFRKRRHGRSPDGTESEQFVVYAQNHDHIGNRLLGERLSQLVDFARLKLAAGVVLLSPFIPLLFMGEEYGETAPFAYFVSHSDPQLIEAVRRGRREEFASFQWQGEVPDPQSENTFQQCKLQRQRTQESGLGVLESFYRELTMLRKSCPSLAVHDKRSIEVLGFEKERTLFVRRWYQGSETALIANFSDAGVELPALPLSSGPWTKRLDSAAERWNGPGSVTPEKLPAPGAIFSPRAFSLFEQTR